MGVINLIESERRALTAIDERELSDLIEQALRGVNSEALRRLPLSSCGSYVAKHLSYFDRYLREFHNSKSEKKREQNYSRARRAGSDLLLAIESMKRRMETEEREEQLFHVDDHILPPDHFSRNMQVTVSYRWRASIDVAWRYGNITFHYEFNPRSDVPEHPSNRKPSVAKKTQQVQSKLFQEWEHLKSLALHSVMDYLRSGRDANKIPSSFKVITDEYTLRLNNFSADFWSENS
jgi:hypothetical protein